MVNHRIEKGRCPSHKKSGAITLGSTESGVELGERKCVH